MPQVGHLAAPPLRHAGQHKILDVNAVVLETEFTGQSPMPGFPLMANLPMQFRQGTYKKNTRLLLPPSLANGMRDDGIGGKCHGLSFPRCGHKSPDSSSAGAKFNTVFGGIY